MGSYKISDLSNLSGVKAHTIRAWEQRYEILTPLRTETNIRYYDDKQLRKLLNVVSLINAGNKISSISKLSESDFSAQINKILSAGSSELKEELIINQLIGSGLSYEEASFEKAFSRSILNFGLIGTYQKILYPMLIKIGYLWTMSELTVSQEHFVTSLVKQKILSATDSLPQPSNPSEKWLLYLPKGEIHDIGLLIAHYALKQKGNEVIYLGKDVEKVNLLEAIKSVRPCRALSFVVKHSQEDLVNNYLTAIDDKHKDLPCIICCDQAYKEKLKLFNNQEIISCFDDFLKRVQ
jgi:DNA-binding transcriptional MerR regulator